MSDELAEGTVSSATFAANVRPDRARPVFEYGDAETRLLASRDPTLGTAIAKFGHIDREVIPDLFAALVNSIVAQQISTKAHATVWARIVETLDGITPESFVSLGTDGIRQFGMSGRKARYIHELSRRVGSGEIDLSAIGDLDDNQVCSRLCEIDGIGVWTAEMLMIFSLQRPDILSFGDAGIRRGLCLLHGLESMDRATFESFRKLYSPYCSVASLYLWKIAAES